MFRSTQRQLIEINYLVYYDALAGIRLRTVTCLPLDVPRAQLIAVSYIHIMKSSGAGFLVITQTTPILPSMQFF